MAGANGEEDDLVSNSDARALMANRDVVSMGIVKKDGGCGAASTFIHSTDLIKYPSKDGDENRGQPCQGEPVVQPRQIPAHLQSVVQPRRGGNGNLYLKSGEISVAQPRE